jgi:hypothetical protein
MLCKVLKHFRKVDEQIESNLESNVSTDRSTPSSAGSLAKASNTGKRRESSSSVESLVAPGRVDCAPMSMKSATTDPQPFYIRYQLKSYKLLLESEVWAVAK